MKTTTHQFAGVTATVYQMEAGDKVPRHRHPNEHTTNVIIGRSEVKIWAADFEDAIRVFELTPGKPDFVLPSGEDHEVTALETPTIIIHMSSVPYNAATDTGMEALPGGVMLDDGTVVPHGS